MRTKTLVLVLVLTSLFCRAAAADEGRLARAAENYDVQRFTEALRLYELLATQGDARAAEMAGQMLYFGETLYGDQVRRDIPRATRWLAQAAQAGRPVATYLLRSVDRAGDAQIRAEGTATHRE